jgi:hypothetical protein
MFGLREEEGEGKEMRERKVNLLFGWRELR